ncbi:sigma-70 family RNA polymerase sigma factor [Lederbergia panacisoli]|uniref:sigma-70 family RNA polymerase sigma factor n=1 Tax=Lederbergia panacisoli TaxID=1255251 RepID=UPI00214B6F58|nr:sigma-70 family RNA polymerase sigma factor [Lederbergia panacisoli]MCR2823610.1 sigma-70 family RNA polymerase sigma factor [Lederbergia panacisoli]
MFIQESDDLEIAKDVLLHKLMLKYGSELKRIAYLYVNDQVECEDIIQEVFISCYENLAKFRHEASYKTWLIRITINKCKDYRKRWSFKNLIYKPKTYSLNTSQSSENVYFQQQHSSEIIEQIASLSGKYKEVIILYYYQEMNMREISDVLNISINTVKSRLLRGKEVLQNKLEMGRKLG